MDRILVLGSGGQLGKTIEEFSAEHSNLKFIFKNSKEIDITDEKKIIDLIATGNFDYCVNCAAYTNVEQAEINPTPAFRINADAVKTLAIACRSEDVSLIQISTDYVFDGTKGFPYTTEDKTNPINQYGKSKLLGEENIRKILPNHFIIRTSWLYSKKYGHNFYRTILKKAQEGAELRITDEQIGCPTNTETLTKFILDEVIQGNIKYGTYHVTDDVPMTWYDFAKQILKENDLSNRVKLVLDRNYRTFARRPKNSVLS
ncbi:dTDP-4-dehydrorhamnose reductase [Flagellimonas zhangzhouensis]|uniref:dTDP-4-dehydrorhamnose reductase n=1 Tax=Flagellimonas zhangzhouensis TaxID=1073328 RepID=A0A1H2USA5_9FLAO|nr:dTDP-4-dehydrorhamnose reductase [Allomuricauda zhangzhouensis]SDQ14349.1 dTDP-4-dehydrorhamnose reductase [Allomuricauda zhangzhouensis]SDW58858.1 dTDP-4-dehydrorhamnose reductase [Allomuricauda zhangzhouensis]